MFHVNPLLGRGFITKMKPYFLRKIRLKIKMSSAAIFVWRFQGYDTGFNIKIQMNKTFDFHLNCICIKCNVLKCV